MNILGSVTKIFTRPSRTKGTAFNVKEFTSEIGKSGFASPAYFMVMITPPSTLAANLKTLTRAMPLRIEQASMPTRSILRHEQRYYGPPRQIPYGFVSQDITFTVILSEDMREREFFMAWQDIILGNSRTMSQAGNLAGGKGGIRNGMYDVGYYDDATKDSCIELMTYATSPALQSSGGKKPGLFSELKEIARAVGFDPSPLTDPFGLNLFGGQKERDIEHACHVKLIEPFPLSVNELPLSWGDDSYAKLQVTFQYRLAQEIVPTFKTPTENTSIANMIRGGIQAFNRFAPTFSLIKGQGIGGAVRASASQVGMGARNAGVAQKSILPF